MRRFMLPLAIVFASLIVLWIYFGMKAQAYQESKYNEAITFVWKVKQHNSEMYEHFFKVRSGINHHYDGLSSAIARLLDDAQILVDQKSDILKPDNLQFSEKSEAFLHAVEKRADMIERFKFKHAFLKSSLAYFYLISKMLDTDHAPDKIKNKMIEVFRKVLLYVTTTGIVTQQDGALEILSDARSSIKEAAILIQNDPDAAHLQLFLSHAKIVLNSSAEINIVTSASNVIPIEYFIEEILVEYQKYNEPLVKGRKKYQVAMLLTSVCFVLLFIYFMVTMSRNAMVLFREKARSKTALSSIHDGVIVTNENGVVEFINPAAEKLTQSKRDIAVGQTIETVFNLVDEKTHEPVENCVRSCLNEDEMKPQNHHAVLITPKNEPLAIKHSVAAIRDQNKKISGSVLVFEDVTQSRRMARELEWAATHDPLTGLVNRREFGNRIVEALITAQLDKQNHALLFMDLDKFKTVNDSGGHAAGDALLIQAVKGIRSILRSSDTFARLGGDEFAVLLTYCPLMNSVQVANKIIKVVRELGFEWEGEVFNIGISIGVTAIDQYSKSDSAVMNLADDACYMAKNSGRNCVRVIEIRKGLVRKRYTGEDILNNVINHEF